MTLYVDRGYLGYLVVAFNLLLLLEQRLTINMVGDWCMVIIGKCVLVEAGCELGGLGQCPITTLWGEALACVTVCLHYIMLQPNLVNSVQFCAE